MGEASSLRDSLTQINNESRAIQNSASLMMRLYEKPHLAVSEWRNTLQSCHIPQLLPLLYVANEVLQNSKRNRGNKFLESFSPILSDSLKLICQREPKLVEKVRRTAKIWGDRRVFSTRFIGSLLKGLDSFRDGAGGVRPNAAGSTTPPFSSLRRSPVSSRSLNSDLDGTGGNKEMSDDELLHNSSSDLFGEAKPSLLNVSNFSSKTITTNSPPSILLRRSGKLKRRRSSSSKSPSSESPQLSSSSSSRHFQQRKRKKKKRSKTLSSGALVTILDQLQELDAQFQSIQFAETSCAALATTSEEGEDAVGEELLSLHTGVCDAITNLGAQEKAAHKIALERKELETEMMRYISWGKAGLTADEEEVKFCDGVEKKLLLLESVHAKGRNVRDLKRKKEAEERAIAEAAARQKEQEEKLKQSLEATLRNSENSRPGMVWNKVAKEYQYLPDVTEESWRD